MMDSALEIKLIECLDALASGETLEQILARHPQDASALRPTLELTLALPRLQIEPSLAAKLASRDAFLAQADAMRKTQPARQLRSLTSMLRVFASLALVLIVGGTALVTLSSPALPGDTLYGVKRTVEQIRLLLATDRATLAEEFEQTRRAEAAALIETGRTAEVEFSGVIESMQEDVWQVSGLTVLLNSNTQIDGDAQVGRRAHVRGLTGANRIDARTIRIEGADQPLPTTTPSPTPTPSNTPAPTSTITTTPSASVTPSLTPTSTPSPSSTATPVISSTSSPAPTSAPPTQSPPTATREDNGNENENGDDGNENGNGNDNGNSNGNDNENGNENQNENDNENHSGPGNGNENKNENDN